MKLRVLKPFGDHEHQVIRQVGEVFEVTKERFASLSSKVPSDFYEEVKASKTKETGE